MLIKERGCIEVTIVRSALLRRKRQSSRSLGSEGRPEGLMQTSAVALSMSSWEYLTSVGPFTVHKIVVPAKVTSADPSAALLTGSTSQANREEREHLEGLEDCIVKLRDPMKPSARSQGKALLLQLDSSHTNRSNGHSNTNNQIVANWGFWSGKK